MSNGFVFVSAFMHNSNTVIAKNITDSHCWL